MSEDIVVVPQGGVLPKRKVNGQFGPGNPGRPKGSTNTKSRAVKEAIHRGFSRQMMAQDEDGNLGPVFDDEGNPVSVLDNIIRKMMENAMEGDAQSFALLLQYMVGRPRQAEEDKSEDPMRAVRRVLEIVQSADNSSFRPSAGDEDIGNNGNE